ncbi:MAG: right-handed parallel beta-helix repeat-containing protein [Myxococcota bacterium]
MRCAVPLLLLLLAACAGAPASAPSPSPSPSPTTSASPSPSPSPEVPGAYPPLVGQISCTDRLFVDAPGLAWVEVRVQAAQGMDGIRAAIADSDRTRPTRVVVEAGRYTGACLMVEDHLRSASAPLWLRGEGQVQIDCSDGNGQAFGFIHASWFAIEGFTFGPERGNYGDSGVHVSGRAVHPEDPAYYGTWEASDHFIIRGNTMRNLNRGADGDQNPDHYESGCCDGAKANQTEYVWYIGNTISRTARHGIDNVGVHHGAVCGNTFFDLVGEGQGVEAKGGSYDIVIENNRFNRVFHRALMLGGEGTNNNFMWPTSFPTEAYGVVARNNLIINAADGGVTFYGCHHCVAANNTVWFTPGYTPVTSHDFMRMYPSVLEGGTYDEWGLARRAGEVLGTRDCAVINNFFGAAAPDLVCPLDASQDGAGTQGLEMHHNLFYSGGQALPGCGEGLNSLDGYPAAGRVLTADGPGVPAMGGFPGPAPMLVPQAGSPLVGAGAADPRAPALDLAGQARPSPPSIGAFEP